MLFWSLQVTKMLLPQINWCLDSWFRLTFSFLCFWCWQFSSICLSARIFLRISCFYWYPWNCTLCWTWNCSFCLQTWATWKVNFLNICKVVILFKPFIKTYKRWFIHRIQIKLKSSSLEVLCKKGVLIISQNSQENTCARVLQLGEACNFIKKETLAQVCSCEFCEIFNWYAAPKFPSIFKYLLLILLIFFM